MNLTLPIFSASAPIRSSLAASGHLRLGALFILLLAASLGLATPAHAADETAKPLGEVVEFGIFNLVGRQRLVENENTPDGKERNARGARFVSNTDQVPAEIGQKFGFRFKITGLPETDTVDLDTIVKLPPMKNEKGEVVTQYKTTTTLPVKNGVVSQVTGYSLDRESELVPGTWTFEHWYKGELLVSQSFTVVAPK